jgi:hypothetical protein
MARTLDEDAGGTVGYAIRFDSRSSAKTRIEVVTEGILTRRIQTDPSLAGVAMVICMVTGYLSSLIVIPSLCSIMGTAKEEIEPK